MSFFLSAVKTLDITFFLIYNFSVLKDKIIFEGVGEWIIKNYLNYVLFGFSGLFY